MNHRNFILKIIKFGLIAGSFLSNSRLLAENLKSCPQNLPKLGVHLYLDSNKGQRTTSTLNQRLKDPLDNASLQEYIALLKLEVVKEYQDFVFGKTWTSESTKYGGERITNKSNATPSQKKLSLVSMRGIGACMKGTAIIFSGEWSLASIESAKRVIQFEEAWNELEKLGVEDPKFNSEGIEKLDKKYPNIYTTEDPKIILEAIDYWKKYRRF